MLLQFGLKKIWSRFGVKKTDESFRQSTLASQRGQGVIEYILVLLVTVSIIVGVLFQFSDAFRHWANNYFGEYLACLLETGELPSVGGLGGSGGLCNAYFEPFSLANGRPPKEGAGSAGTTNTGGGGSGSGSSAKNSSNSGENGDGVGYSDGAPGRGANSGQRFRAASPEAGISMLTSSRAGDGDVQKDKVYTGSTSNSLPAGYQRASEKATLIKVDRTGLDRGFQAERNPETGIEQRISVQSRGADNSKKQEKILIKRALAEAKAPDVEADMGFGDYLRYLIIAAIIIALVVFLGGQALQMGKSLD